MQMTRGHHACDICGWEDADYGNGEIWLEICGQYWRMPRMIWHYVADHEYKLPDEVDAALAVGDYTLLQTTTDCEGIPTQKVAIPYYEIAAFWDADRYDSLVEFDAAIRVAWNQSHSWKRDGSYGITLNDASSLHIHNLFAEDPDNFPDRITVTRIAPNKSLNRPPQSGAG
ncbi:MAG: hypothetical protein HQ567_25405 [Candidatus Nealsonbacteria bacterium]|nr:hypothetical protein [Candidatus Nealsonbacteria bacterium]